MMLCNMPFLALDLEDVWGERNTVSALTSHYRNLNYKEPKVMEHIM